MGKYTKQDIFRMVEEEDVEFIRLQFTDMFGVLKNVAITSSQLGKALDNKCMFDAAAPNIIYNIKTLSTCYYLPIINSTLCDSPLFIYYFINTCYAVKTYASSYS